MKRWCGSLAVVCLAVAISVRAAETEQARPLAPGGRPPSAKIDEIFADWSHADSPGCAVVVVKDGRIDYERGYGMANLELGIPNTPQTVFDIGSVSKQFTAMSILLLAQDGKLSLEDDIRKYLPEIPDYGATITIQHLLHHTSGLRDYDDLFDLAGIPEIDLTTDRDALELVARQKGVNFKPGEEFLYSNTGFFLLSQIVKRVTGQSLRQFAQVRIFEPLGMKSTHFHDDHTMIVPRRATGYAPHDGGGYVLDMSSFEQLGDGSVMTTVEDLFKWDKNFENPVVGGPEAIRQLTTPGTLGDGTPIKYGMGLFMDRYHGLRWIHHSGEWVGYRTAASRFPDQHFSTWITCNCVGSMNPMLMATRIADLYLGGQFQDRPERVSPQASTPIETPEPYAGLYRSDKTGAFRHFVMKDGRLVLDSAGTSVPLAQLGKGEFEYKSDDSEIVDRYVFGLGRAGGASRLEAVEDGSKVEYELVKEADVSPSRLSEYTGSYVNSELRATWTLTVKDGKLIRQQWMNEDQELRPAFFDGFTGDLSEGEFTLHFTRDPSNRVTGFEVATEMVRPMRFKKVETSPDHR